MLTTAACGHRVYQPEDADRLPVTAPMRSQRGDIWRLGGSRLVCGDATDPRARAAACDGFAIDAAVFDPPWDGDATPSPEMLRAPSRFVFTDNSWLPRTVAVFGPPASVLVWDCVSVTRGAARPPRGMKLCLVYGDWRYRYDGDTWDRRVPFAQRRTSCTLPEVFRLPIAALHRGGDRHQKPVTWFRRIIGCLSRGDVFDPYAGTGTTLLSCAQLGRRCAAIERDPRQCDRILARWQAWTGATAERGGTL